MHLATLKRTNRSEFVVAIGHFPPKKPMPSRTPTIPLVPEVLSWARESAGLSQTTLARKIGTVPGIVAGWEKRDGSALITVSQLEKFADAVKRPTAALLLHSPPKEASPPKDFRRPTKRNEPYSSELRRAIRRTRRLQRVAAEISEIIGEVIEPDIPVSFSTDDDPQYAAVDIRGALSIPDDAHTKWNNERDALRGWRTIVESRNILVFSADFPRDEAQGFSVSDQRPNIITLSAKDAPTARSFTLWHEFAHILLRDAGLCITEEPERVNASIDRNTEDWCNRFAGAFLLPKASFSTHSSTSKVTNRESGYESQLKSLARYFKVSQYVILFRMRHIGLIPDALFWEEFNRVKKEQGEAARLADEARKRNPKRSGAPDPANIAVRNNGQRLAKALLTAFDNGNVTHAELADYFGARLKHLERIRREAYRE